ALPHHLERHVFQGARLRRAGWVLPAAGGSDPGADRAVGAAAEEAGEMSAQPTHQPKERTPAPTSPPAPTLKPSRRSTHLRNTWHLGVKEFHSLARDMALLFLIVFMFSVSIYADARAKPESLNRASIAVVDEDRSQLSTRMVAALQPPQFI